MHSAIYYKKQIIALDIKYPQIEYYRNLTIENKLLCPCCKKPVILRYGDKKQPHFAHKKANDKCLLSNMKDDDKKLIEEAQKDILMRLRTLYKNCNAEYQLNVFKNETLIHVLTEFESGEIIKIRFLTSLKDSPLDGYINLYLYNSKKNDISKDEIFKHCIKYNINTRIFVRGYFNVKENILTKYLTEIESIIINPDNTINTKLFKRER